MAQAVKIRFGLLFCLVGAVLAVWLLGRGCLTPGPVSPVSPVSPISSVNPAFAAAVPDMPQDLMRALARSEKLERMTFAVHFPVKIIVVGQNISFTCEHYQYSLETNAADFQNCNIHLDDAQAFWRNFKVYLPVVGK